MNVAGTDLRPSSVERAFDRITAVAASGSSWSCAAEVIGAQIGRVLCADGRGVVVAGSDPPPGDSPAALRLPLDLAGRPAATLVLPPRRGGRPYTARDVRVGRLLASQGALALDQLRTRHALEAARDELAVALRKVEALEGIRTALAKFVPRTVRAVLEHGPDAAGLERRPADVSILFVDIVDSTRLAERLSPDSANYVVERYFGAFLDEILAHGGDVNETSGDGLMAIFQGPAPRDHARAAVEAGLGILRRTAELNRELAPRFGPIAVHVAANSGPATVGVRRIEGTSGTRWTYTASGPVTNLAARLTELSCGDALIAGPDTYDRLAAEYPFEEVGSCLLRNIDRPIRAWRLGIPTLDGSAPSRHGTIPAGPPFPDARRRRSGPLHGRRGATPLTEMPSIGGENGDRASACRTPAAAQPTYHSRTRVPSHVKALAGRPQGVPH